MYPNLSKKVSKSVFTLKVVYNKKAQKVTKYLGYF